MITIAGMPTPRPILVFVESDRPDVNSVEGCEEEVDRIEEIPLVIVDKLVDAVCVI